MGVNLISDDNSGLKKTFLRAYWSSAMNYNIVVGWYLGMKKGERFG